MIFQKNKIFIFGIPIKSKMWLGSDLSGSYALLLQFEFVIFLNHKYRNILV